jgi:hypothetical protein
MCTHMIYQSCEKVPELCYDRKTLSSDIPNPISLIDRAS